MVLARWFPDSSRKSCLAARFGLKACTAAGSRGLCGAHGESAGTVTERTGDQWYRVTNCTGSPRGGSTPRSHTACSARTASASLQRPVSAVCALCTALHCSIPSIYPSLSQMWAVRWPGHCRQSPLHATRHCTNRTHAPNDATDTIL